MKPSYKESSMEVMKKLRKFTARWIVLKLE